MRPVQAAAGACDAAAGVDEEDAVEVLEGVLAVAGQQLVHRLGQQGESVAPVLYSIRFLLDLDVVERLALDLELAVGLLVIVVVHAAVVGVWPVPLLVGVSRLNIASSQSFGVIFGLCLTSGYSTK